jgi:hypothetical protein
MNIYESQVGLESKAINPLQMYANDVHLSDEKIRNEINKGYLWNTSKELGSETKAEKTE